MAIRIQVIGVLYNLVVKGESYFANNASAYGNRVSLSMSVTQSTIDTVSYTNLFSQGSAASSADCPLPCRILQAGLYGGRRM